jgi:pimeloyl-ACP methyl ester carboxylesterase
MVQRNPNAELVVIPGAGHTVPLDQPELLAEAVRAFLL